MLCSLLFQSSGETLQQIAADLKHLGAEIGFLSVLHTWGQNLHHHPHVHCVVPGGGRSPCGTRWISCPKGFFPPVRVPSPVFRGKFLEGLQQAFDLGRLQFQGRLSHLQRASRFRRLIREVRKKPWVVYAKRPFAGPEAVLKYLARYTHRVAISNRRLVSLSDGQVSFRWKDYRRGRKTRVMTLDAVEFIRRFLQHTLPKGFVRIRHFGFLSEPVPAREAHALSPAPGCARDRPEGARERGGFHRSTLPLLRPGAHGTRRFDPAGSARHDRTGDARLVVEPSSARRNQQPEQEAEAPCPGILHPRYEICA